MFCLCDPSIVVPYNTYYYTFGKNREFLTNFIMDRTENGLRADGVVIMIYSRRRESREYAVHARLLN